MKVHRILAGTALVAALVPAAQAQTQRGITSSPDAYPRQFLYFLPKAAVGATVTQRRMEAIKAENELGDLLFKDSAP
jgi:heme A synthase